VCGIKGWQTNAATDGCLQRVRATGKPACLPVALHLTTSGIAVTFSAPLDAGAADASNVDVSCWNYVWSEGYGSPEFSVAEPKRKGHDHLEVSGATLSADKRTLTAAVKGMTTCMQMEVSLRLQGADGTPVEAAIYATANALGK
jgi:hypothetical protein